MDKRPQQRGELKRRALADLDRARVLLSHHSERATLEFSPAAIVARSFQRHRAAWLAGAAVAGVVALRWFLSGSGKNERDKFSKSGTKHWLFGLLGGSLVSAGRKAALAYATKYLQDHLKQRFQQPPADERDPT